MKTDGKNLFEGPREGSQTEYEVLSSVLSRLEVTHMESYTKQYWEVLSASFAASKHIQCKECKGVIRGLRVKSHLCAKVCVCVKTLWCVKAFVCVRVFVCA